MSEKKEYKLSGMTCAACAMTVEMAVKDLETVEDVSVNLATERLSQVIDKKRASAPLEIKCHCPQGQCRCGHGKEAH